MHELSLAMSVAGIASRELAKQPGGRLRAVRVRVGELAGVEIDTFRTALETVFAADFPAGVRTELEITGGRAECIDCGHVFAARGRFPSCPQCDSAACMLVGGTELTVSSLTIERDGPEEE